MTISQDQAKLADAQTVVERAELAKQFVDREQARKDKESDESLALLMTTVKRLVGLAVIQGDLKPGLAKLWVYGQSEPKKAFLELVWDLLTASPVTALTKSNGVLTWNFKVYGSLNDLAKELSQLADYPMDSDSAWLTPIINLVLDRELMTLAQAGAMAVRYALKADISFEVPEGLTFSDQARLALALGQQVM